MISNNKNAYALIRAQKAGIEAHCVSPKDFEERGEFNAALMDTIDALCPDLIVLAGFLVVIPSELIRKYENRIINIHPSLIPSFCGKGYYGLKVHEAALARGVKVTGARCILWMKGRIRGRFFSRKRWKYARVIRLRCFSGV